MLGIILSLVFAALTFIVLFLNTGFIGMPWWNHFVHFVKGGLPIFFFFVAVISFFIGVNDLRDSQARKKELMLENEKEEKVEEAKKEEQTEETK